jgi:hypothetical protein
MASTRGVLPPAPSQEELGARIGLKLGDIVRLDRRTWKTDEFSYPKFDTDLVVARFTEMGDEVWVNVKHVGQAQPHTYPIYTHWTKAKKPTVPEVLPLVRALYGRSSVGCCLHIALDDGNVEDGSVKYCVTTAVERGHKECEELARKLLLMSKTQRRKLATVR